MIHPDASFVRETSYFFDAGLRFECTHCGACCSGAPGRVLVGDEEQNRIAEFLRLELKTFALHYLRAVEGGAGLVEHPNGDCVFFAKGRCRIHAVKPDQCRLYPFWFENLRSEEAWRATCAQCPGIGHGRLYSRETLLALIEKDLERRATFSKVGKNAEDVHPIPG